MKKIILTLVLAVMATPLFAQDAFEKMGNLKNISETVVTKDAFELLAEIDMDIDDDGIKAGKGLLDSLKDARFYSTSNADSAKKMIAMANSYISSNGLVKLMSVKEDDQLFSFHVKKGSNSKKVKVLVMVIDETMNAGNPEALVMKITGDIDLAQISKITKMINVPGQKQIEDATKE
ncbi:uncharacterized protein DUF4252 [Nonlabens xylanidelens]|uniref:Uncharacterized protein DUF4252 n=1 Tax=Nonlabens xylanidelens TaxID=191564 RepID=A0A2S6IIA1_9FLAO|nr:DUF4252 domain-containing protein [Nonlabens xylanidelens]PPK93954.1 uncharacterized protein DUF4252 [Nonlabens xylanidelens]PQJ22110.1 hypothetical protein BST94_00600 [Nonlabens xylanidelens]